MKGANSRPALHNAMWPGLVGKGEGSEPAIGLDKMLELTRHAEVDGQRFDGVDLFLSLPHIDIDSSPSEITALAAKIEEMDLKVGSLVAPVWGATGGGSAMGNEAERKQFITQVEKACRIADGLNASGVRTYGVIRIDSATPVSEWAKDPVANTRRISETFREACAVADNYGEKLAAEGEICWGGMHSWRHMIELLETVDRPKTLGFQADMAHTMLFVIGANAPEDRLLPENFDFTDHEQLSTAYRKMAAALRPWTIDFHVAQNDGTVKGEGSHDKTGKHCPPGDPNGKLDIVRDAGAWLRDDTGAPSRAFQHICWDGCMFPNATMLKSQTWNDVLRTMIGVRDAHGWN